MTSSNAILSANGGVHSKRAMKKVKDRLQNHGMKRAILVGFVLTGSQSVQVYQDTYNDIADHIRDNGSRCEYFGCLEMDVLKGLHAHVFFVIETSKKFPHKTLDVTDGAWLHKLAERRGLNRIHIAQPQNKMHDSNGKKQFFARLDDDVKLEDCLERVEYLYKNRSKENVPSREIYFNSNFEANKVRRAKKKPVSLFPAASPAAKEENIPLERGKVVSDKTIKNPVVPTLNPNQDKNNGAEMTAAEKYVASRYEAAVDQQLDLEALRLYLLAAGIKRTPAQVVHELEETFGFHGYASSHPAPKKLTQAEIDAQLGGKEKPSKVDRTFPLPPYRLPIGRGQTNTNRQGTT